jgi:hypothetical protein
LRTVIDSPYADEVLRTIARIQLGWIKQRGLRQAVSGETNNEYYTKAIRDISTMTAEKQRLVRDALPAKVRPEWETIDYLNQSQPVSSNSDKANGGK